MKRVSKPGVRAKPVGTKRRDPRPTGSVSGAYRFEKKIRALAKQYELRFAGSSYAYREIARPAEGAPFVDVCVTTRWGGNWIPVRFINDCIAVTGALRAEVGYLDDATYAEGLNVTLHDVQGLK